MTFGQLKSSYFEECDGVHNYNCGLLRYDVARNYGLYLQRQLFDKCRLEAFI